MAHLIYSNPHFQKKSEFTHLSIAPYDSPMFLRFIYEENQKNITYCEKLLKERTQHYSLAHNKKNSHIDAFTAIKFFRRHASLHGIGFNIAFHDPFQKICLLEFFTQKYTQFIDSNSIDFLIHEKKFPRELIYPALATIPLDQMLFNQ